MYRTEEFSEIISKYDLEGKIVKIVNGYASECIPLYCKNGYVSMLYSDGESVPFREIRCKKEGELVGFIIKLENPSHIFHELEHAKRYLRHKSQNEILVELISLLKRLMFSAYKVRRKSFYKA